MHDITGSVPSARKARNALSVSPGAPQPTIPNTDRGVSVRLTLRHCSSRSFAVAGGSGGTAVVVVRECERTTTSIMARIGSHQLASAMASAPRVMFLPNQQDPRLAPGQNVA